MTQLSLFRAPCRRRLTLPLMAEVGLSPAVFYFASREVAAGRPLPAVRGVEWTAARVAFVDEFTFGSPA